MAKKKNKAKEEEVLEQDDQAKEEVKEDGKASKAKTVEEELAEMKDKYLRQYSEFENFRKRTAKERLELIYTSTEDLMEALLPVLDDFDRAVEQMNSTEEVSQLKEGVELIHHKIKSVLAQKGLKEMESSVGKTFDAELQEAITQAPAPSDKLKGKIMDEIEKGYQLNDKIIRFAKVVIGQ